MWCSWLGCPIHSLKVGKVTYSIIFIKSVVQFCKIPKSMKTVVFLSLSHSKILFLINMFTNLQNVPFQNYRREGAQIES